MQSMLFSGAKARKRFYSAALNLWDSLLPDVCGAKWGKRLAPPTLRQLPKRSQHVMATHIKANFPYLETMTDNEVCDLVVNGPPRTFVMSCGATVTFVRDNAASGTQRLQLSRCSDVREPDPWGFSVVFDEGRMDSSVSSVTTAMTSGDVAGVAIPVQMLVMESSPSNDFAGYFEAFEQQKPVAAVLVGWRGGDDSGASVSHRARQPTLASTDPAVRSATSPQALRDYLRRILDAAQELTLELPVSASRVSDSSHSSTINDINGNRADGNVGNVPDPLLAADVRRTATTGRSTRQFFSAQTRQKRLAHRLPVVQRVSRIQGNLFSVTVTIPPRSGQQDCSIPSSVFRILRKGSPLISVLGATTLQRTVFERATLIKAGTLVLVRIKQPRVNAYYGRRALKNTLEKVFAGDNAWPHKMVLICEWRKRTRVHR
jgi:hypothetical protein